MLKKLLAFTCLTLSIGANAASIGLSPQSPGYSAKDILLQGSAMPDGLYWIDPDLPGNNAAFQAYADMSSNGGGWTLANDANGSFDLPSYAIDILAVDQDAQIRLVGGGLDARYTGRYGADLTGAEVWSWNTGNSPSSFYGASWDSIDLDTYDIYVREVDNISYPSAVPIPAAAWLFGSALLGLGAIKRRKA